MARGSKQSEPKEQYLPDGDGGSFEPERNDALDRKIEDYLNAKDTIAECRDRMNEAREAMIAIALQAGIRYYRHGYGERIYQMDLVDETRVKLAAVQTE